MKKYFAPIIISLPMLILPYSTGGKVSWEIVALILGCLWMGVALGVEIGKD